MHACADRESCRVVKVGFTSMNREMGVEYNLMSRGVVIEQKIGEVEQVG